MKKILWVSNFAPYVSKNHAGGKTFSYYFDNFFNDENYELSLVCCHWEKDENKLGEDLNYLSKKLKKIDRMKIIHPEKGLKYKIKRLANIESRFNVFTKYVNMISNYSVNEIMKTLKRWKKENYKPDFIILEWTQIVFLAERVKKLFPSAKLIASEHDVSFIGFERKLSYFNSFSWKIKTKKLKKLELNSLKKCDYILVHNKDNKKPLVDLGINSEKIEWLVPYFDNMLENKRMPKKETIIFYGAMYREENYLSAIWFIENVMPRIKDLNLKFVVIGANAVPELFKFQSENVEITGFVESIIPYFESAMCFVAPLLMGAGIKVKVIEALSSGIPILTNSIGIEGIDAKDCEHYFNAETPEEYEKLIRDLYNDKISIDEGVVKTFLKENFNLENSVNNYKSIINKN